MPPRVTRRVIAEIVSISSPFVSFVVPFSGFRITHQGSTEKSLGRRRGGNPCLRRPRHRPSPQQRRRGKLRVNHAQVSRKRKEGAGRGQRWRVSPSSAVH